MMTNIKQITHAIFCQGLSIRTTNQDEMNIDTAKIGAIWEEFYQTCSTKLPVGSDVYGIYHNYESDATGAFDVVASFGHDVELEPTCQLQKVTIPQGKYLVFSEQGTMPDAVITAWATIWQYFADINCEHTRLYDVDFEHYVSASQVDVYIGVE